MAVKKMLPFFSGRLSAYNGVKTPVIFQLSETECGITALAIVFSFYQFNPPFEALRERCGTSRDGSKAVTLIQAARSCGFEAEAFKIEIESVSLLQEPVIAFWGFNHYVVLEGFGRNQVFINDPASGRRRVSFNEFDRQFTGVILSITPTEQSPQLKRPSLIREIIQEWLSEFRLELIFLWIGLLFIVSSPLLSSAFQRIFIDQCVILSRQSWIPYLVGFSLGAALILIVSTIFQEWNQFKLCTKLSLIKSSRIISHTFKLPLLFFSIRQKSEMIAMLLRAEGAIHLLTKNSVSLMVGLMSSMGCIICMMSVDRLLAILSFLISAIFFASLYGVAQWKLAYEKASLHAAGKLYVASISNIRNVETIKACAFEEKSLKKWQWLFIKKLSSDDKIRGFNILLESLNKLHAALATLMIFFLGGFRIAQGVISVGTLMAYYAIHLFFSKTISMILEGVKGTQTAYASHLRIQDILKCAPDVRFTAEKLESPQLKGVLTCQKVTFFYNPNIPATLKNIQAEIQPGQHIALVGTTGSGKSTLARLLCGLYQPHAGEITLAGRSLASLTANELTAYFSYVSQDVTLFAGTLYENLTLWKKEISPVLLEKAISIACLSELVEMRGLYGKVEEQGHNFSGGEKQRIDIARSLIQNTPILILDEATSALDIETESKVIKNLRKTGQTIIFVAHRLSTIKHCDQIWVLQEGQIVERGDHLHLMQAKGRYYDLVKADYHLEERALNELSVC